MAVRTASGGKVGASDDGASYADVPEVRVWSLTIEPEVKTYASSTTLGKRKRILGQEDYSGTISLYVDEGSRYDGAAFNLKAGQTPFLKFYEDSDDFYLAQVFIESVEAEVDIENGEIIGATVNFSREGDLTYPT